MKVWATWIALVASAVLIVLTVYVVKGRESWKQLEVRLNQIRPMQGEEDISCAEVSRSHPLVVLVLGQSNAGNHGEKVSVALEPVTLFAQGKCVRAVEPLPGATGQGGSIWSRLPRHLAAGGFDRPVLMSVLAVDASSVYEWVGEGSPLLERMKNQVLSMQQAGFAPDLVLWQQGEADARIGTTADNYSDGLIRLSGELLKMGSHAPVLLARSTVCRSPPSSVIDLARRQVMSASTQFRPGPDIDRLQDASMRFDGCHLTGAGLDVAAKMWAESVIQNTPTVSGR